MKNISNARVDFPVDGKLFYNTSHVGITVNDVSITYSMVCGKPPKNARIFKVWKAAWPIKAHR